MKIDQNIISKTNNFNQDKTRLWFFKLKGYQKINSDEEIKIARDLSPRMAERFLETRGYIRESLSSLFKIDPLSVPIIAYPNKPPELPNNLGYISISHTKDALIIAWDKKRIGVDMERKDRIFNYNLLSKKLLRNSTQGDFKDKFDILNFWCGLESAIKWERGSIISGMDSWKFNKRNNICSNKDKKMNLSINQFYFYSWTISIASKKKYKNHMVCTKENDKFL